MTPRVPNAIRMTTVTAVALGLVASSALGAGAAADTTPPVATLHFSAIAAPDRQYAAGSTIFVNPASVGKFLVSVSASDAQSGIASVTFPALLGSGAWADTAGPYSRGYTWPIGLRSAVTASVIVTNKAGKSTALPFTVSPDATAPAVGASVSAPGGRTAATTAIVSAVPGAGDTGSGIASRVLQRESDNSGKCTSWTSTVLGSLGTTTYQDSGLIPGSCVLYRLLETDRVGNQRVTSAPTPLRVNAVPTVVNATVTTAEDTDVALPLKATDPDGDPLSYNVTTGPAHGRLLGSAPELTYSPSKDFSGTDTIRFTVSDGFGTPVAGTVTLTVDPVNDAPVAQPQSLTVPEDTALPVVLSATDVDGPRLSYEVLTQPRDGRLSGVAPDLTYTPTKDFNGADSFTFRANDGSSTSQTATVTIGVTPVNDAPSAEASSLVTSAGKPATATLAGVDVDGDPLTYRVVANPTHGSVAQVGSSVTYTPAPGFSGTDSFSYVASDGQVSSPPAVVSVTVAPPPATAPLAFSASGLDGAGFQNVVAVDPRGTGLVVSAADVSGFSRSTDWGRTFSTANAGLTALSQLQAATLAFSPSTAGKLYAGVGSRGAGGGLLVSTDEGRSWTMQSKVPQFSGGNNDVPGLPTRHPRSTGNLLAFGPDGKTIYAATFKQGVLRSTDDGKTWTVLGLEGKYLRSIAIDSAHPDTVYVGTYGDGIYRTSSASGAGVFEKLPSSPVNAEELLVLGGNVYVAGGSAGVFRSTDGGSTWAQLGAGKVRTDGPIWMAIAGYRDAATGKDIVVAGAENAAKNSTGTFDSLLRTTDGGLTWSSLTADSTHVHDEVGGPGGKSWWLLQKQSSMALGKGSFTASHLVVTPSRVFVAGRSGVWGSSDAGNNWYPLVDGMGVTINQQVVADPNTPGRIYVSNTDWVTLYSADGGRTVVQNRPPTGVMGSALALDTSVTPSVVYSAVGERDSNTAGEIYANADPARSGTWVSQGLGAATGGKRVLAMAVRRVNGSPVIVAAVEGGGVWRKEGTTWTKVESGAMSTEGRNFASLAWPAGGTLYLHDPKTGVWRSNDAGVTWTKVWAKTSFATSTTSLAVDPKVAGRVYVSVAGDGVYRLDTAQSGLAGSGMTPVALSGVSHPGPIATGPAGQLYATDLVNGRGVLLASADNGTTWRTVSDATYASTAGFPFAMSVGSDGTAYLSLNGNGVLRGTVG